MLRHLTGKKMDDKEKFGQIIASSSDEMGLRERIFIEDLCMKYKWFSLGKVLLTKFFSTDSYEYLKMIKNIDLENYKSIIDSESDLNENVIDSFLEKNISKMKIYENPDDVKDIVFEEESWELIEEVARFMIMSGDRNKAIEIYKKLIVDFPEKKSYFVSEIEKI